MASGHSPILTVSGRVVSDTGRGGHSPGIAATDAVEGMTSSAGGALSSSPVATYTDTERPVWVAPEPRLGEQMWRTLPALADSARLCCSPWGGSTDPFTSASSRRPLVNESVPESVAGVCPRRGGQRIGFSVKRKVVMRKPPLELSTGDGFQCALNTSEIQQSMKISALKRISIDARTTSGRMVII